MTVKIGFPRFSFYMMDSVTNDTRSRCTQTQPFVPLLQ